MLTFYGNSLFIAVMNTALVLFTSSLFGFIFAKYSFKGKNVIFWFILATMMIPFQVLIIPGYLILVKLGLLNSLWGLIVGSALDAFGIFLITQVVIAARGTLALSPCNKSDNKKKNGSP